MQSLPDSPFTGALPDAGSAGAARPPFDNDPGPFDAAALARLANAMFAALPGDASRAIGPQAGLPSTPPATVPGVGQVMPLSGAQFPSQWAPAGSPLVSPAGFGPAIPGTPIPQGQIPGANLLPASPTQLPSLANRAPGLLPHATAPNGVPDTFISAVPAYEPRLSGAVLGVPEVYGLGDSSARYPGAGADNGLIDGPSLGGDASPFYFIRDNVGSDRLQSSGASRGLPASPHTDPHAHSHARPHARPHVDPRRDAGVHARSPIDGSRVSDELAGQPYADPAGADTRALLAPKAPGHAPGSSYTSSAPAARPTAGPFDFPRLDSRPGLPLDSLGSPGSLPQTPQNPARYATPFASAFPAPIPAHAPTQGMPTQPRAGEPQFYFADAVLLPSGHVTPESPDRHGHQRHGRDVPQSARSAHPAFDVHAVRRDFPILQERVNGRPLAWFDNAATTQKPQSVIDRLAHFYAHENSNIHRAAHELAARATDAYEGARQRVKTFINAPDVNEVIFVRGTTEAINLVAKSWGAQHVGEGDEIIVSHLEHHANIVPWQQLASSKGAKLRVIPVDDSGQVLLDEYRKLLSDRTKIVSVTQVSNALGTVVPVKEIIELAHRAGAKALVDGAQSVSHMRVDVQDLGADFFVFSGHKVFGPTGIGVLWGKRAVLEDMPPWQGGGNMIADVTFEKTVYQALPNKFEAGTGNIADAVGLGAAIDYVNHIGIENIARFEHELLVHGMRQLGSIQGVRLIGTAADKASVMSFVLAGHTTEEVGHALNDEGIAVRTGHHCAQPILRRMGVETTVRPSLAFYNTFDEIDRMVAVVKRLAAQRRTG